jgi:transposase InsO family protein
MVSRAFIYKWLARFNAKHLPSLESKSRRPKRTRSVTYSEELVSCIRKIRQDYPSFAAVKVACILLRDFGVQISAATVGRIIKRFNLFFSRMVQVRKNLSRAAKRGWRTRKQKERKPYGLKAMRPHQIIEFDMKHIMLGNQVHYAFCAIDPYLKQALVHVAATPSSTNALVAIRKILEIYGDVTNGFGRRLTIVNDNGSENMGVVYDYLKEQDITQLFTRPHTPKDKPYIENFIGKLQKECLNEDDRTRKTVAERQQQINLWLNDFHFYRPHQALNYQTPQEFCDRLGIAIPRVGV